MSLGENLKALRKKKGWTQQQLAEAAGIKLTHISTLEKNDSDPKLSTIGKLIEALGCSANDLIVAPGKAGISTVLRNYLERTADLPTEDKLLLIRLIDKFMAAESLRIAEYSKVPDQVLRDVIEFDLHLAQAEEGELLAEEDGDAVEETVRKTVTHKYGLDL